MDARRRLSVIAAGLTLSGCALWRTEHPPLAALTFASVDEAYEPDSPSEPPSPGRPPFESPSSETGTARPYLEAAEATEPAPDAASPAAALTGRRAIAAANSAASAPSRSDRFQGGVQIFTWSPGRVFEVWTAPLRVTTLTLGAGERLVAKAAGDTVRWQIGETVSGEGTTRRAHVLIKPLERGLDTNLVLTTNQRIYLIDLRSGAPDGFNAAVSWEPLTPVRLAIPAVGAAARRETRIPDPVVMPEGRLDARYRLASSGRRPRWTPTAVFNDGRRTFIVFPADLQVDEAPALFVIAPDGEAQLVNYRQAGGLFIVDRVLDRAELRLGDRRPQVVRILRLSGAAS
ncbi:P-type conjugative transfer protein TrbG [Brevundimonas phoenicis]|uniref:P-type conjugative transfer protein TrbG n=1 Tax=unclassified Brevundimonas TaxID=2622653 RepID=UPI0039B072BA